MAIRIAKGMIDMPNDAQGIGQRWPRDWTLIKRIRQDARPIILVIKLNSKHFSDGKFWRVRTVGVAR